MDPMLARLLIMGALFAPDDDASAGGGGTGGGSKDDAGKGKGGAGTGDRGNADDDAAKAKAPKYSDDDLNGRIASERRKWETKSASELAARDAKITDLEKRIAALGEKRDDATADGDTKDARKLQQQITKLEADVAKLSKERDDSAGALTALTSRVKRGAAAQAIRTALVAGGAIDNAKALDQAARLMIDDGDPEIEVDDLGRVKRLEIAVGDKRFTGEKALSEAVAAFLAENDHLRKASSGGGTKGPKGLPKGRKLADMSPAEAIAAAYEDE